MEIIGRKHQWIIHVVRHENLLQPTLEGPMEGNCDPGDVKYSGWWMTSGM